MYASLYKIPTTSILDNRKFISPDSIIYEVPPKVNKYIPDETLEEKINYSYGPNLKDSGAGEVYSYRYDGNYVGNRDIGDVLGSVIDKPKLPFDPSTGIQYDRSGKDKLLNNPDKNILEKRTSNFKETYQETKPSNTNKSDSDSKSEGTCQADSDGVKNICNSEHQLFPIMDPRFNIREAAKNMILLEDHLFHMGKRCQDCILKHCLTIEGFLEEGITLDIKGNHRKTLQKSSDNFRNIFIDIANSVKDNNLTNEDCFRIAQEIRKIRKPLCQGYATFI